MRRESPSEFAVSSLGPAVKSENLATARRRETAAPVAMASCARTSASRVAAEARHQRAQSVLAERPHREHSTPHTASGKQANKYAPRRMPFQPAEATVNETASAASSAPERAAPRQSRMGAFQRLVSSSQSAVTVIVVTVSISTLATREPTQ